MPKQNKKVKEAVAQSEIFSNTYAKFLINLKKRIKTAQIKASLEVNRELINLY